MTSRHYKLVLGGNALDLEKNVDKELTNPNAQLYGNPLWSGCYYAQAVLITIPSTTVDRDHPLLG